MLSVCVVTQQLGRIISGPGLHASNLARCLAAGGHAVTVIAPEDQRPPGALPYHFVDVPRPLFSSSQARWISLSLAFGRALKRLETETSFDLVHFTDGREALFCSSRAPRVGNANDTYSAQIESLGYYRRRYRDWGVRWLYYHFVHLCESRVYPRLDAVLANSHYTAEVISRQYHIDPARLHVIYKSVDASFFTPALEKRSQARVHPPVVLYVGGNMQRKGVPDLIRAAPAVLKIIPECQFWITGKDPAEPAMQALCRQHGVADAFHFMGWKSQAELVDLYALASVFAMPSLTEAFGVVYLEAMAAGVPVVGTNVGGIPEIISDRQNGRLVPAQDPPTLAQALLDILQDPKEQEHLRRAGLETVRQFSVERMMSRTYEIYASLRQVN